LFGFVSVIALVLAGAGATALVYDDKVLPNTYVGGIAVGGLTPLQAKQSIVSKAQSLGSGEVLLTIGIEQKNTTLDALGVELLPSETPIFGKSTGTFSWLHPSFWQEFFKSKQLAISHEINQEKFQSAVEKLFKLNSAARNASISEFDGQLKVTPAKSGVQIEIAEAIRSLETSFENGQKPKLTFSYSESIAEVSTETANQTKTEIIASLKPVVLNGDGTRLYLTVSDQFQLITYNISGNQLNWSISKDKIKAYLESKVNWRFNIAMVQKITQIKPEAVIQKGRDGRYVATNKLVNDLYSAITGGRGGDVEIPLQIVAFTESRVAAGYIPDLFDVRYVDVNLAKQQMYIVEGDRAVKTFLVSTGQTGLPTPRGVFYIKNKIPLAQSRLYPGIWMRYWNALAKTPNGGGYEGYGIHDLPCFDKNCNYVEGASHLGRPVSHGCIRLGHENAIWFYGNIPIGTPVNIH